MAPSERRLRDVSPTVGSGSPVFPGDTEYAEAWTFRQGPGCPVNVARLTLSPHTGAHADAPLHYVADGRAAADLELTAYLGTCRVVHALDPGPLVTWEHLAPAVDDGLPPRLLVRQYAAAPVDRWDPSFAGIAPDALERLADRGLRLVGTDAASLDPADSKTLDAHHVAHRRDLRILENLVLDDVPEGDYELIALPLKLATADAAPVRAVLRELA